MDADLTLVPTPIGNLGDITLRALETLKNAGHVFAEDTRVTRKLFSHYGITAPLSAFHQHNEHRLTERLIEQMLSGQKIVLVSDAGTPGISDPAFLLVRAAVEAGLKVECLPGATAFVPALVASGFPCDRFVFEGFLPHKKGRQKKLLNLKDEERTIIFYESPHRLIKTMEQIAEFIGTDRRICVVREISKIHEEYARGTSAELIEHFTKKEPKGEIVILLEGIKKQKKEEDTED